jgi:hypothetical protein
MKAVPHGTTIVAMISSKKKGATVSERARRRGIRWTVLFLALLALACYVSLFLSRMNGHVNRDSHGVSASKIHKAPW